MTVARSVADVVTEHVLFEVECIDRMYLNVYVPGLQYAKGLVGYVHRQLGLPIASTAPLARITDRFTAAEGRALRTETTINNTRDFEIGKRLTHLPALREIGYTANRRLLRVQQLSHDPITGADALAAITAPVTTATGARVSGLRFADQRSHALLSAVLIFRLHPNGFTNKDLRTLTAELRGLDPDTVSAGQMTYDLRRLKTRNLIARIEGTHRYQVTDHGLDTAKFLTCVHDRVLRTGLAELATPTTTPGRLRAAATAYRTAVDTLTATAQLAA
ncbi:hypothetical protein [Rhodococcus jostii]|nr:hypothetical protein [Rhodococcus jostii]